MWSLQRKTDSSVWAFVAFSEWFDWLREKVDTGNFRNADNEKLEKALLMAFDPYTNKEVMEVWKKQTKTED